MMRFESVYLKKPGQRERRQHRKCATDFGAGADQKSDKSADADLTGFFGVRVGAQFANDRADQWAEDRADQAEKDADDTADECAPQRLFAGAGGFGALVFQGLLSSALDLVLLGVIPVIALAVVVDALFALGIALLEVKQP